MSPGSHCYFDHYQGEPKTKLDCFWRLYQCGKSVFFNPIPKELSEEESEIYFRCSSQSLDGIHQHTRTC